MQKPSIPHHSSSILTVRTRRFHAKKTKARLVRQIQLMMQSKKPRIIPAKSQAPSNWKHLCRLHDVAYARPDTTVPPLKRSVHAASYALYCDLNPASKEKRGKWGQTSRQSPILNHSTRNSNIVSMVGCNRRINGSRKTPPGAMPIRRHPFSPILQPNHTTDLRDFVHHTASRNSNHDNYDIDRTIKTKENYLFKDARRSILWGRNKIYVI